MTAPASPSSSGPPGAHPGNEFRRDPLTGEWVAIVAHRQTRPNLADEPARVEGCPFCVGGLEAPEPYAVKAFPNRWPPFHPGPPVADDPGAARLPAVGAAEVVLYTPRHTGSFATIGVDGTRRVVDLWAERTAALLARPEIASVLVFENRGTLVGATIPHPHGQIYAFPFVPPALRTELDRSQERCVVCTALGAEVVDGSRVVRDDAGWVTYVPFASGYPYGVLLVPHTHTDGLPALDGPARDGLAAALVDLVGRYDALFPTADPEPVDAEFPYLMWVHQQPGDRRAHLHLHFAPPLRAAGVPRYVASGELGSGTLSNPVAPEDAAAALRAGTPPARRCEPR